MGSRRQASCFCLDLHWHLIHFQNTHTEPGNTSTGQHSTEGQRNPALSPGTGARRRVPRISVQRTPVWGLLCSRGWGVSGGSFVGTDRRDTLRRNGGCSSGHLHSLAEMKNVQLRQHWNENIAYQGSSGTHFMGKHPCAGRVCGVQFIVHVDFYLRPCPKLAPRTREAMNTYLWWLTKIFTRFLMFALDYSCYLLVTILPCKALVRICWFTVRSGVTTA